MREVEFEIDIQRRRFLVALEPELAQQVAEQARVRGISTETLVNLWLKEKLSQAA
jgi:predicted HicB family RNase H-like nuclease